MDKYDGLMLRCGGEPASFEDLGAVPLPGQTETYVPESHTELVKLVVEITSDILKVRLEKAGYGLAYNGNHMFAHLRFKNGHGNKEMGLCVGLVNSYDKRLRVRFASGANVFVCDSLAIAGDITYPRRYSSGVLENINWDISDNVGMAGYVFSRIVEDAERMKQTEVSDDAAYQFIGLLYGRKILGDRMMTIARKQWDKPDYKAFEPRTEWSLYNALNRALKLARPGDIIEKHRELHELLAGPKQEFDHL